MDLIYLFVHDFEVSINIFFYMSPALQILSERKHKEINHIKIQLFIKKSYALCLFAVCLNSIIGRIFKFKEYDSTELIINMGMISYVFLMELIFKKQY